MSRLWLITVMGLAFLCATVWGTIINVPAEYATIQAGVDAASPGDTVLVQPGSYRENIVIDQVPVTLASMFLITGDPGFISATTINGSEAGSVVSISWWNDSTSVITGFTLTNGGGIYGGGGVHTDGSPLISHNIIEYNTATRGGGIYSTGSSRIVDNIIRNNHVTVAGGGIISYGGAFIVERNIITDNTSETYGGGIHIEDSQMSTIRDNLIMRNTAVSRGGGIVFYTEDMGGNLSGNVIAFNEADMYSSIGIDYGVYRLVNNTICSNSNTGEGLIFNEYCEATLINNIIWNNADNEIVVDPTATVSISYCDIAGGFAGEGNIDIDPLFRDPDDGDFHLMATVCDDPENSPCIDAGHPDYLDRLLDCDWGLGEFIADMGAYGGGDSLIIGIDESEPQLPENIFAVQAFPNPFNASTIIKYELPRQLSVSIEIYDILGRKIANLQNGPQAAGYHQVLWQPEHVASGAYFYLLQAGDYVGTKKMILMK